MDKSAKEASKAAEKAAKDQEKLAQIEKETEIIF